ncbi:esterase/lipase family protein [Aureliella helgolandensis]|uniref:Alpha/beta hydrolase family protein n=1 Tax=Aureliella helgolandensis TaxID=2527968 RepID=A0A518G1F5_9BACT|nr:lipase [Aureliella helgolandensis]QDV22374.1 Alpha/beta hydrolase family protein [Aureliella helgolandensis]
MRNILVNLVGWLLCSVCAVTAGQDNSVEEEVAASLPNLKIPTLGGKQFWTDYQWRQGWRVQQNALTGHWRLLDFQNFRHAWGSREACDAALNEKVPTKEIESQHLVLLLHGLSRSASSMAAIGEAIERETDMQVAYFEYASTRASIAEHAAALREVVAGLPGGLKLSFIGHSMGNIIVRHAIGDWQADQDQATLRRLNSVVMLGPPNQGASIARQLSRTGLFGFVTGRGGMELGPNWEKLAEKLATPPCPFGIVAGRLPDQWQLNPLVDGEGDFVVSVEETRLAGAADELEVPRLHSFLMDDETVQEATILFLQTGHFPHPAP